MLNKYQKHISFVHCSFSDVPFGSQASLDEIRHAQIAFSIASVYAGRLLGPGHFIPHQLTVSDDIETMARHTIDEGCIEETIASLSVARESTTNSDHYLRTVLRSVANDEARHAALAWRTVRWALKVANAAAKNRDDGESTLRTAIEKQFASWRMHERRPIALEADRVIISKLQRSVLFDEEPKINCSSTTELLLFDENAILDTIVDELSR
jgi:hypothetical protein